MKRIHQILLGVLAIQIILSVAVFWPRGANTSEGKLLLPDLNVDAVVAITLTNDSEQTISLKKVDGEWGMADADQYPVNGENVESLLEKMTRVNDSNLVASTEISQRQLQVADDDFLRRVDVELQDGSSFTFYLGTAPRYTATHFRVKGQKETYLTSEFSTWELNPAPSSWIDTSYTSVDQTTLTEVQLVNANGTFTFVKEGENWQFVELAEGDTADAGKVNDVISKAGNVTIQRPLGNTKKENYGLDEPLATVTLKTADKTYTLTVGAKNPDDSSYVIASSESDYYIAAAEYSIQPLVENTYDSFLEVAPTPTP